MVIMMLASSLSFLCFFFSLLFVLFSVVAVGQSLSTRPDIIGSEISKVPYKPFLRLIGPLSLICSVRCCLFGG